MDGSRSDPGAVWNVDGMSLPRSTVRLLFFMTHIASHQRGHAEVRRVTAIPPFAVHGAHSTLGTMGRGKQMDASAEAAHGIRRVARDLLKQGIDGLVEASTDLILGEEPTYGQAHVGRTDLSRETHRTLSLTLHRLAGIDVPEELRSAAYETGLRRAEQGLPLASLLHAFRIDLRLLWDAITQEVRRLENLERLTVLEQHTLLWEALEANTADVVEAYRVVEARQAQRLDQRDREVFKRFLAAGERQAEALEAFAAHAALPPEGHYSAFVVTGLADPREAATILRARLRTSRHRSFVTVYKEDLHGLARQRPDHPLRAELLADVTGEASAAAVLASGLGGVPRAFRVARRVAAARQPGSFSDVGSDPFEQIAALEPELVEAVLEPRLRVLSDLTATEASGIWETVEALFVGDGTVTDIAARTYRHRNTVRARIDRLRELTGFDCRVPSDLAMLALAVGRRGNARSPAVDPSNAKQRSDPEPNLPPA